MVSWWWPFWGVKLKLCPADRAIAICVDAIEVVLNWCARPIGLGGRYLCILVGIELFEVPDEFAVMQVGAFSLTQLAIAINIVGGKI